MFHLIMATILLLKLSGTSVLLGKSNHRFMCDGNKIHKNLMQHLWAVSAVGSCRRRKTTSTFPLQFNGKNKKLVYPITRKTLFSLLILSIYRSDKFLLANLVNFFGEISNLFKCLSICYI